MESTFYGQLLPGRHTPEGAGRRSRHFRDSGNPVTTCSRTSQPLGGRLVNADAAKTAADEQGSSGDRPGGGRPGGRVQVVDGTRDRPPGKTAENWSRRDGIRSPRSFVVHAMDPGWPSNDTCSTGAPCSRRSDLIVTSPVSDGHSIQIA